MKKNRGIGGNHTLTWQALEVKIIRRAKLVFAALDRLARSSEKAIL